MKVGEQNACDQEIFHITGTFLYRCSETVDFTQGIPKKQLWIFTELRAII